MNSVKNKHDVSKYTLRMKDLDPNDPYHARILENFRNTKHLKVQHTHKTRDLKRVSPRREVTL